MYYFAKITGVIPKGMDLKEAPTETQIFKDLTQAKEWLLGEALNELPTPVHSVEITLDASGTESVWREYHWGHDALKAKNKQ